MLLHDPLRALQAVGRWPVANLLLPAFGTAFALTWLVRSLALSSLALRARMAMDGCNVGHRVIDLATLLDGTKSSWRFNAGG